MRANQSMRERDGDCGSDGGGHFAVAFFIEVVVVLVGGG